MDKGLINNKYLNLDELHCVVQMYTQNIGLLLRSFKL